MAELAFGRPETNFFETCAATASTHPRIRLRPYISHRSAKTCRWTPGQTPHFPKVLRIFLRDFLYKIAPSSQNRSNWRFAVIWPKWYFAVPGPILSKPRLRVPSNPPETGSAVGFGGPVRGEPAGWGGRIRGCGLLWARKGPLIGQVGVKTSYFHHRGHFPQKPAHRSAFGSS